MADFNFQQAIGTAITTAVPLIILLVTNRRTAKKENDAKHQENQQVQGQIRTLLQYHPPHTHSEREGPLQAEGIVFPPK